MNIKLFKKDEDGGNKELSFVISVALHAALFFILAFVLNATVESSMVRTIYLDVSETKGEEKTPVANKVEEDLPEDKIEPPAENEPVEEEPGATITSDYLVYSDEAADTAGLENIYRETTLDVSIKYPAGWTYIDQNVKEKLDAVTFWSATGRYKPPPYIFLEVKEKYLFNPKRYKHNMELQNDAVAYYNDPEELEGQVSQVFYIRTDDDEDYSLKLIMQGQDQFKSFQPAFFGMLKTFKFGDSFF